MPQHKDEMRFQHRMDFVMYPSIEEVLVYEGTATHMAISMDADTPDIDMQMPTELFRHLAAESPRAFLFERTGENGDAGKYSVFGYDIKTTLRVEQGEIICHTGTEETTLDTTNPLSAIRNMLSAYRIVRAPKSSQQNRFQGGAIGYLGFDCVTSMENIPLAACPGLDVPQAIFFFTEDVYCYDHTTRQLTCVTHIPLSGDRRSAYEQAKHRLQHAAMRISMVPRDIPPEQPEEFSEPLPSLETALTELAVRCSRDRADMKAAIMEAKDAIARGEVFQVVLSQRVSASCTVPPFDVYCTLREVSPAPYMFFLRYDDIAVLGASPELLARLTGEQLLVAPIAGTRRRGTTSEEDEKLEQELLADEKELAEHRMLVDLGRNDLGRVAHPGSVQVEGPPYAVRYSHVMHLVSNVHGKLASGRDAFNVLQSCFPAGTVSGAPKIRACELIARLEPDRRSVYAGAVGYIDFCGDMDMGIAIRTLVVKDGEAHLQTGAGIVHDSIPDNEVEECWNKARAGLVALAAAHRRYGGTINV